MSGIFQTGLISKVTGPLGKMANTIDPLNKFNAKIDPLADMAGLRGKGAQPVQGADPFGFGLGFYGKDSTAANAQIAANNRVLGLQQQVTDPTLAAAATTDAATRQRTSASLAKPDSTSTLLGQ